MVKIQIYPTDISYKLVKDRPVVLLYGKTTDGKRICVQDKNFEPYLMVVVKDPESAQKNIKNSNIMDDERKIPITKIEIVKRKYLNQDLRLLKVHTKNPKDISKIKSELREEYSVFEYDLKFTRRYLVDREIVPFVLTDVEGELLNKKSRVSVLDAQSIEQNSTEVLDNINVLAVDIETYNPRGKNVDAEKDPIVMVALYGKDFRKVIVTKKFQTDLDYIEFAEDEAELLTKLKDHINDFKPDCITGYYSDEFDLPYIETRASKNNVKLDIGLDYSPIIVRKGRRTSARMMGIVHLDIYQFIRKAFRTTLDTPRYSLGDVAKELIGAEKDEVDLGKLAKVYNESPEDLEIYCKYNLRDTELTFKLAHELMPNLIELIKAIGLTLYDVSRMGFSQLVEWYLIRRSKDFNELVPNRPSRDELKKRRNQTYKGAFVYKPSPGLYENIVISDFRSLYPSIITTHNISPDTLNCDCCEGKNKVPGLDYWFCENKKGFISTLISELITRRQRINEIIKDKKSKILFARQYAIKTIANAMYGYLGFYISRWYCLECAKSITSYGRYYIQMLIDDAKEQNFKILYGDTDSIFLALEDKTRQDAQKFIESVNHKLPEHMELESEGFYPRGIFVSAKMGSYGAKKKYALLSEKGDIKITGLETIRRNISPIAKRTQLRVLELILKDNDTKKALHYVKKVVDDLRKDKVDIKDLVIHTQLQKELSEYQSIGPHVAVARILKKKGFDVGPGTVIQYVISEDGDKIRDRAKPVEDCKNYDENYYINNQVIPAVDKIFEVIGYSKENLLASLDQKKLDKFF
ncbi:MAG: DNA polymerase [Candidatus Woesearchaeota archaeon]|nr:DNA polymerase [Candidatus Woesearchaeota archaeon]